MLEIYLPVGFLRKLAGELFWMRNFSRERFLWRTPRSGCHMRNEEWSIHNESDPNIAKISRGTRKIFFSNQLMKLRSK